MERVGGLSLARGLNFRPPDSTVWLCRGGRRHRADLLQQREHQRTAAIKSGRSGIGYIDCTIDPPIAGSIHHSVACCGRYSHHKTPLGAPAPLRAAHYCCRSDHAAKRTAKRAERLRAPQEPHEHIRLPTPRPRDLPTGHRRERDVVAVRAHARPGAGLTKSALHAGA